MSADHRTKEKNVSRRPRDKGLEVKVSGGILTISIGVESLKWAAEHCDDYYLPMTDKWAMVVADADEFAKDVATELLGEEDGTTLVHIMLDNAIKRVSENGSQAQDIDAMEALEEAERKEVEAP